MTSKFFGCGFALAICLIFAPALSAQIFFTEGFDYADGDLNTVSGGLWPTHSGTNTEIQVVGGEAIVVSPGSFDHNRQTGVIAGPEDVWYYACKFSVQLGSGSQINNDYFIHLKDDGTQNFRARLATAPSTTGDFGLQIWASSMGDGLADWDGEFDFGETIIAVVRWDNLSGDATLWVNPVDENSTSVTDTELEDAGDALESVALRQDSSSSSEVAVDILSVGTDFAAVLAEVSATGGDCPSGFARGDVNQDGEINLLDVGPFVDAIGGAFVCEADIDESGTVDLLDVGPFVALLGG